MYLEINHLILSIVFTSCRISLSSWFSWTVGFSFLPCCCPEVFHWIQLIHFASRLPAAHHPAWEVLPVPADVGAAQGSVQEDTQTGVLHGHHQHAPVHRHQRAAAGVGRSADTDSFVVPVIFSHRPALFLYFLSLLNAVPSLCRASVRAAHSEQSQLPQHPEWPGSRLFQLRIRQLRSQSNHRVAGHRATPSTREYVFTFDMTFHFVPHSVDYCFLHPDSPVPNLWMRAYLCCSCTVNSRRVTRCFLLRSLPARVHPASATSARVRGWAGMAEPHRAGSQHPVGPLYVCEEQHGFRDQTHHVQGV